MRPSRLSVASCSRPVPPRATRARGFSLLEVMVSVAILGLVLTVILSAQGGLAASNRGAANMGQAASLGRCKMTELEEQMLKLGFPELDQVEDDVECCVDENREGFRCATRIEKIELPNFTDGNSLGDGGALTGAFAAASGAPPGGPGPAGGAGLNLNIDAGIAGIGGQIAGQLGSGGTEGLLSMVMGIVYPSIKPMFEASVRRVTVTVRWKEGPNAREFPLVQYVTNPQRGGFAGSALLPDGGALDFAPPGTRPATQSTTSPATTTPGTTTPGLFR